MNRELIELNAGETEDLIHEIEELSTKLDNLRLRLATAKRRQRQQPQCNRTLIIGSRVVVTSSYRERRDITGTITRLTNAQAYVKTDDSGDVFRVYKANLRLVEKQD